MRFTPAREVCQERHDTCRTRSLPYAHLVNMAGQTWGAWAVVRYGVRFATDDEMPDGHDVVLVEMEDETVLFYRESIVDCRVVSEAWAAFHAVAPDLLKQAG